MEKWHNAIENSNALFLEYAKQIYRLKLTSTVILLFKMYIFKTKMYGKLSIDFKMSKWMQ
jgi:hypothetical protein